MQLAQLAQLAQLVQLVQLVLLLQRKQFPMINIELPFLVFANQRPPRLPVKSRPFPMYLLVADKTVLVYALQLQV